jgi:hypothetical protein
MAAVAQNAHAGPSDWLGRAADFVRPDFHQVNLDIEGYLKAERNYKLDSGTSVVKSTRRVRGYESPLWPSRLQLHDMRNCILMYRRPNMSPVPPTARLSPRSNPMPVPPHHPLQPQLSTPTRPAESSTRARKKVDRMQALPPKSVQDGRQLRVHTRL